MLEKIKQFINKLRHIELIKVFSWTSISTLVKMAASFVSVKIVSVIIGTTGVALLGQLNNFNSIIQTVATGGITSGLTKYVAENGDNKEEQKEFIGTAVKITLLLTALCGIVLIFGAKFFSQKILFDNGYSFVFIIFGVTLVFYALNTLLMAVINGFKDFSLYVKVNIVSSLVGLGISLALVVPLGVNGALINLVTSQSFIFIITLFILWLTKIEYFHKEYFWGRFNFRKMRKLAKFSIMTIVTNFTLPISQLLLRSLVIDKFGMVDAGCWEGMNRISNMYLMVITTSLSVYYMPKLSELKEEKLVKHEILNGYKVIIPTLAVVFTVIYLLRGIFVKILFSSEFQPMTNLFLFQLIGDLFKISSWLLSFMLGAKAMVMESCLCEIIFSFWYVFLSYIMTSVLNFGVQGVVIGYMINYITYLIAMYFIVWRRIHKICKR
jgi:O-antigen/teichoic acid export membrane protein